MNENYKNYIYNETDRLWECDTALLKLFEQIKEHVVNDPFLMAIQFHHPCFKKQNFVYCYLLLQPPLSFFKEFI